MSQVHAIACTTSRPLTFNSRTTSTLTEIFLHGTDISCGFMNKHCSRNAATKVLSRTGTGHSQLMIRACHLSLTEARLPWEEMENLYSTALLCSLPLENSS